MAFFDSLLNSRFVDQYGPSLAPSFDFIDSSASSETDLPLQPETVAAAVHRALEEKGHQIAGVSEDGLAIAAITKKTWTSWELLARFDITPTAQGSHLTIFIANVPGRPTALLDGKKNRKVAAKLAEQVAQSV